MKLTPLRREVTRVTTGGKGKDVVLRKRNPIRWIVLVVIFAVTVMLTSPFYLFKPPAPQPGATLPEPVRAQTDFRFEQQSALDAYEKERRQFYHRVYQFKPDVRGAVQGSLDKILAQTESLDRKLSAAELLVALRRIDSRLAFVKEQDAPTFVAFLQDHRFRQVFRGVLKAAYDDHVIVERVISFKGFMSDRAVRVESRGEELRNRPDMLENPLPYPVEDAEWYPIVHRHLTAFPPDVDTAAAWRTMRDLLTILIQPNLVYDEQLSELSYQNYPKKDISTLYVKGQVLVDAASAARGISKEQAALLAKHRAAMEVRHRVRLGGHAMFVLIVFVIISFYIRKLTRDLAFTTYSTVLISLPVLIALAVQAFMLLLAEGKSDVVGYLFPAGAIGMLGVLLLDVRMALLLVTWGCLLFGLQTNLDYQFVIVGLFGGYTGVAMLYTIRKRWEVFVASIAIGIANVAVILITAFIQNPDNIPLAPMGLGFVSGIASFLILAILPVFERFGIVTDMQLLELTGLHHPLLRLIEERAPGTWQHTLNVAKLAEAAAAEIGVSYLLVRAGCYYHDVGKSTKPEYFTENQITNEDKMRHAALKPQMSTLIIKNHVKEGVELALEYRIPERIIDFIRQHHGTSLIAFFYNKAVEMHEKNESLKEPVRLEDYRYPGPKPQTIEAAIVMLADTVEATATAKFSGRSVREDDIKQVVRNTILDKFNDGQFDECNLTLRDLNVIRETFVEVLKSRFHTRIDYPKQKTQQPAKPAKKQDRDGLPASSSNNPISPQSSTPLLSQAGVALPEQKKD
ncbi:HDIG domain-containing protein [Candidatus Sumerlaeota bacterium]|nr:HDIG domain-containing protein [Candidatus Sumerlaeota bacterium]